MNVFLIAGIAGMAIGVILFIVYLVLDKGTGKRLRKQLQKEYQAK